LLSFIGVGSTGIPFSTQVFLPDGTKLQGSREGSVDTFKGIPFAEPPVGARRWTAPEKWTNPNTSDVLDATSFGHTCVQWLWGDDGLFDEGSEDCLYLNVFVSAKARTRIQQDPSSSLPVAVFVHGGSYITGGTAIPLYDGVDMVEYWNGRAVLVTTNYRLNVFGFLGSEELRQGDPNKSAGNYGLQDQRMAFDWVQRNIGSFGGDPSRVTIFGESAGAGSMTNHLVAPKSWGLFQAVALESGSFAEWASVSMSCAQGNYDSLLEKTGCDGVMCLRALPAKLLRDIAGSNKGNCSYGPVVDGVELTTHPWIALADGNVADVPVLHGTNADEGAIFAVLSHQATEEELHEYWREYGYSEEEIVKLDQLYVTDAEYPSTPLNNSLYWWAGQRALGDDFMTCPAQYASQQLSLLQTNGSRQSNTYLYHFEHLPRNQSLTRHVAELEFVFHQNELLSDMRDAQMGDVMASYWGNFFVAMDPNVESVGVSRLAAWNTYEADEDNLLVLREANDVYMANGIKKDVCSFVIRRLDSIIRDQFITTFLSNPLTMSNYVM